MRGILLILGWLMVAFGAAMVAGHIGKQKDRRGSYESIYTCIALGVVVVAAGLCLIAFGG